MPQINVMVRRSHGELRAPSPASQNQHYLIYLFSCEHQSNWLLLVPYATGYLLHLIIILFYKGLNKNQEKLGEKRVTDCPGNRIGNFRISPPSHV